MRDSKEIFAERLRNLIEEKGMSQKQLAAETQIAESSISKYLSCDAEPKLVPLANIAKYFDVSVDYLLGISNCKQYEKNIQAASKFTGLADEALINISRLNGRERIVFEEIVCHGLFRELLRHVISYVKNRERDISRKYINTYMEEEIIPKLKDETEERQNFFHRMFWDKHRDLGSRKIANGETLTLFSITNTITEIVKTVGEKVAKREFADKIQNCLNREMIYRCEEFLHPPKISIDEQEDAQDGEYSSETE